MKKIFYSIALCSLLAACDSFLDVEPKGQVIPTTVDDYELLLNGGQGTLHSLYNEDVLALTADDFNMARSNFGPAVVDVKNPDNQEFQMYTWGEYRFYNPRVSVASWNGGYENIYTYNKIINEVMEAESGIEFSEKDKPRIRAEALYGRALDYFFLVNTFAKAYSSTANKDLSIPIVTKADVTQQSGPRATIKEVYDFIINDLNESIKNLPQKSKTLLRPNIWAGYALLARVYLYKGDYEKAGEYADKALSSSTYQLKDYNTMPPRELQNYYILERYAHRYFGGTSGYYGDLSEDFRNSIDTTNDLRYTLFFDPYGGKTAYTIYYSSSVSVGEMYITRAECYARLGKKDLAIADLNTLGKNRIVNYTALQSADFSSDTKLIKYCLEERRRELVTTQIRLFDVKRMNLEPDYAITITKQFQGETYTAEPNSGKLVLPIPAQVLKFNPSWEK